ncbi:hypothetical protein [Actinokineospora pegani]|uniref:hypothetical protein n=1 Tax=Actinokineospora pegani TaxID=2654637 RepID=UPI0012EA1E7C|nr:hypothetical protein [Actinokineospora pegani]
MSFRARALIALALAVPLSAAAAGTASADDFSEQGLHVGHGGVAHDIVSSSVSDDGVSTYFKRKMILGPAGIMFSGTSANAG